MARGRKRKSTAKSFGDFKKAQNEKRLDRIISQGQKDYANQNRGQSGGSSSIPSQGKKDAFLNLQKQKFFGDRDIPEERIIRRTKQEGGINQFKQALEDKGRVMTGTRPDGSTYVVMNSNTGQPVFLSETPGGRTVEGVRQDLVSRFGPTDKEVAGDIGYGLGQLAKAYGIPFVGTAQRIAGGVSDLYDYLFEKPTVTYGGSSDMTVTEEPTFVSPTIDNQKINVQQLQGLLPPSKQGDDTFRDEYPFLYDSRLDNLPFKAKPNVSDQTDFETALANARVDNLGLPSLTDLYNFGKNPELKTNVGNFRFDNVLSGNPQLGYGNTFMVNGLPVDLNATIGQGGLNFGASMNFKKGGSVDKYAGLGYKLK